MGQPAVFSPADLAAITDCTLKFHFFRQTMATAFEESPLEAVVLQTINHLHASGGPHRLNLPATLRAMAQFVPESHARNVPLHATARQMVASYHRRLRGEWPHIIASQESMALAIRLSTGSIRVEAAIDRVDKAADGGVTAIQFVPWPSPIPEIDLETDIETTILHALVAANYPEKRPVRITYLWLYHNQTLSVELTEKTFRQNIERMRRRVAAWQAGEIVAQPGPYCDQCPFQYQGCPVFLHDVSPPTEQDSQTDLPQAQAPANLSPNEDEMKT